jgi:Na+/H+-dicarboxylate symporter
MLAFTILKSKPIILYTLMILLGIAAGLSEIHFLQALGQMVSDIFIKIFKCISIPIIALSIIVTLSSYVSTTMNQVLRRTALYTLTTTLIAAAVSCGLYLFIQPTNVVKTSIVSADISATNTINYWQYLTTLIPSNFLSPFLENQVISVLLIGILIGTAIRYIPDEEAKKTVIQFFKGVHGFFFVITKWIVAILPIGLFGFITTTVAQMHHGMNMQGLGQYLIVIIAANLIQGFVVLPTWLKLQGISPFKTMRNMMPALSVAFFSKSSVGTLPVTIAIAEKNLQIDPKISRFVLPLCTSINMNGCAAFIFTTVIYLMQNNGIPISFSTMGLWIIISTVAAIGNAGVPMGCFFLSASLLASMNVPIVLMGVILPFYSVIDMIETTLNVWSDSCVTKIIDSQQTLQKNTKLAIQIQGQVLN